MHNEKTNTLGSALTRRQLLRNAARTGLFLLLPMAPMLEEPATAAPAHWVTVGKAGQFRVDQPQRVALPGGVLFVTRLQGGTLSAVSAKCTHHGCEVGWDAADNQLLCPCHGAAFKPDGRNIHGTRRDPAQTLPPLAPVAVRQQKGLVQVNLASVAPGDMTPRPGR